MQELETRKKELCPWEYIYVKAGWSSHEIIWSNNHLCYDV